MIFLLSIFYAFDCFFEIFIKNKILSFKQNLTITSNFAEYDKNLIIKKL